MASDEAKMTSAQLVKLLDAAMSSRHPILFLDAVVTTFEMVGRRQDATAVTWIRRLYAQDEIEMLMGLRTAWERGGGTALGEAARGDVRARRSAGDME